MVGSWGGMVDNSMVSDWNSMSHNSMMLLFASLCTQSESDLLATGLSNDDLLLVNSVGGINKLGHIEALVLNLVLTLNLSDGDVLNNTNLFWCRIGKAAGDLKRGTYQENSETMKVTTCGVQAPAYGYGHQAPAYGHGEHQLCHEEYQTQAYKVPLVTAPLEVSCSLAYPAPKEVCVVKDITITEVKCEDKIENKCFNVAKFVDATNTVDQKEIIIGEPSCEQITLTLGTQACKQQHHAVVAHAVPVAHHAVVHHATPTTYHG
jgi:hypothetical protein